MHTHSRRTETDFDGTLDIPEGRLRGAQRLRELHEGEALGAAVVREDLAEVVEQDRVQARRGDELALRGGSHRVERDGGRRVARRVRVEQVVGRR